MGDKCKTCKYEWTDKQLFIIVALLVAMSIIFTTVIASGIAEAKVAEELGQAICEEEYDLDFDSYYDKELRCKPKGTDYDGLRVKVREE